MKQSQPLSNKNHRLQNPEKLITGNDPVAVYLLRQIYASLKDNNQKKPGTTELELIKEIENAYKNKKAGDTTLLNGLGELLNQAYELLQPDCRTWSGKKEELYAIFERIIFLKAREDVFKDFFDELEKTITSAMLLDFSKRVPSSKIITQEGNIFDYAALMINMLVEKLEESVVSVNAVNTILLNVPSTITIVTDKSGKIRFINNLGEVFLGVPRHEFIGQSICAIFLNYDSIEERLSANGQIKEMNVLVAVGEKTAPAVLSAIKATSYTKELEEIVYTINLQKIGSPNPIELRRETHDKIAPLNTILGITELIEDRLIDAESKQLCNLLKNSVLRLKSDAVYQLQLISGEIRKEPSELINVSELINETIESLSFNEGFKEVKIYKEVEADFYARKSAFRSIIQNLLSNAIKCRKRNEENTIKIRFTKTQQGRFLFEISDTGIGIKKEFLEDLFINSYSTSRAVEGFGAGLAIVKDNVKKLNGEIRVTSEYGKGSVFSITFHQRQMSN
jgi:signal transduction histidine kinase